VPVLAAQAFAPDQDEAWSLASRLLSQAGQRLSVAVAAILAEPEASALAEVVPGLSGPPGTGFGGLDEQNRRAFALQGPQVPQDRASIGRAHFACRSSCLWESCGDAAAAQTCGIPVGLGRVATVRPDVLHLWYG
jgi:hypothetical protein